MVMVLKGDTRDEHIGQAGGQIEAKVEEVAIIFQAHTIHDPRTVMVHEEDALVANFAM